MTLTPTLSTSHLVLRPLTKPSQRQLDWLRDRETMQYSEQRHRTHTLTSQLDWITGQPTGSHLWAIRLIETDGHIGNMCAAADEANEVVDLGILIGERDCWGKGYATEAFRAATTWLLGKDDGGFRKVEAGCMANNAPMKRVLFHAGFTQEGERRNHFLHHGAPVGLIYFGKFR
jgi:RimJ/RimL family protein N-acetyltransferase